MNSIIKPQYTGPMGFPGGSDGKASVCNAGDLGSIPGSGRFPWRRKWQPTPVHLPGKFHGLRSLVGYSPWVAKSRTRLSDFTFTYLPLRFTIIKELLHFSISFVPFCWIIPKQISNIILFHPCILQYPFLYRYFLIYYYCYLNKMNSLDYSKLLHTYLFQTHILFYIRI